MQTAFRVVYSLVVAILFVLFIILGTRTFYAEPERDSYSPWGQSWEDYRQERADHHRNVFIAATILGVGAVAGGLYLYRRVEAIPLGLMLGGLGVVIYAWAQSAEDFGEIGMAPLFAVVAVGLAVVLVAGYLFLGLRSPPGEGPSG